MTQPPVPTKTLRAILIVLHLSPTYLTQHQVLLELTLKYMPSSLPLLSGTIFILVTVTPHPNFGSLSMHFSSFPLLIHYHDRANHKQAYATPLPQPHPGFLFHPEESPHSNMACKALKWTSSAPISNPSLATSFHFLWSQYPHLFVPQTYSSLRFCLLLLCMKLSPFPHLCMTDVFSSGLSTNIMSLERLPWTTIILSLSHHPALFPSQQLYSFKIIFFICLLFNILAPH